MPWTGIEPARPGLKVRIGSQQPPRRCALRTGLKPVISRSTGGRPLRLDRQSLAEGGGVEPHGQSHDPGSNRAPGHPGVAFHPRRERGSNSHARVGLPSSRRLPAPAIGWSLHMPASASGRTRTCMPARAPWSTARRASQLPNRRVCRSAGIPDVSAVGRCGDRKRSRRAGPAPA